MKKHERLFGTILLLVVAVFTGCKSTDIVQLSPDTYTITVEDHAGIFGGSAAKLKSQTIREADAFAESKGKIAIPVSMQQHPVGMGFRDWASCEYQFEVLDKNDPKAIRTPLVPQTDPGVVTQQTQQQMQRQAYLQQWQAAQRQQQQNIQNALQQDKAALERNTSGFSQFQLPLLSQQAQSTAFPNLQRDPKLPSAMDMPTSSDMQTGKIKFGPDGRIWNEYRTITGYTYWSLAQ